MFGTIGPQEILLILLVILLLFGAKKIPEIMRGFGQGLQEFKRASTEVMDEIDKAASKASKPPPPPTISAAASSSTTEEGRATEASARADDTSGD